MPRAYRSGGGGGGVLVLEPWSWPDEDCGAVLLTVQFFGVDGVPPIMYSTKPAPFGSARTVGLWANGGSLTT